MLVKISIENFKSFDKKEELSMISSSKMQGNKNHRVKIKQTQLLKSAIVYDAVFAAFPRTAAAVSARPPGKSCFPSAGPCGAIRCCFCWKPGKTP